MTWDPRVPGNEELAAARALEGLAGSVQPPPPRYDLAAVVRGRIEAEARKPAAEPDRRRQPVRRVLATAAALAGLTAGGVGVTRLAGSPRPRSAIAAGRTTVAAPVPPAPDTPVYRKTTLNAVRGKLGFAVLVPADLGTPDTVIDQSRPGAPRVVLVYGADDSPSPVHVVESEGNEEYANVGDATLVRHDGFTGFWFQAPPQIGIVSADRDGWLSGHPLRKWNSLLWQRSGVTIRLDSSLPLTDAVALASSMTPVEIERNLRTLS